MMGGHQRRIQCQLHTSENGQSLGHDLQPPCIGVAARDVEVSDHHVVETQVPASRQICSTALSTANPRLLRTPALLHAARWWPNKSRRRPHTQERTDKDKGILRRLKRSTLKGSDSILATQHVGNDVKGTEANGPLCDLDALCEVDKKGHTTSSRCCSWTFADATPLSATHVWVVSGLSRCLTLRPYSGLKPADNTSQFGVSTPIRRNRLAASSTAWKHHDDLVAIP